MMSGAPILLVAALLSTLLLRSGLDAYAIIAAATAAVAYVVMTAGHLLLDASGEHGRNPSTGFVVGLLAVCLAVYALTELLPVTAASGFGAVAALVIGMRLVRRRRLDAAAPAVAAVDWRRLAGFALCVAFTYAWCAAPSSAYEPLRTQGVLPVWADYFFHGGLISQFGDSRALGHGSIFFAGQSPTFYHFGSYGVAAALAGMLDQPGLPIATSAWLPLGFLAMLAGAYALGERLADSAGGVAALAAVAIIPDASNYWLRNGFFSFHWTISATVGATYALGAAFVSLVFLDRWATERSRAALAASALLALASLLFRVQIFLLYFPAWLAAAAICSAREGAQRHLVTRVMLVGLAAGAVACYLTINYLIATDPGFWPFLGGALEGFLRSVHTDQEPTAYTGLYAYLETANAPAIKLTAGIVLAIVAALGAFVLLLPAACQLAREKRVLKPIDALCGLLFYCWLLLMLFAPVLFNGDSTDLIHRPFVLLYAAAAIWTVCLVLRVVALRFDRVRVWLALLLAAILALPAIVSDAPGMMHPKFRWGEPYVSMRIPPGLVEAAAFMRKHAAAGDVFGVAGLSATYAAIDLPLQVCALSGMPAYLSRPFLEMSKDGPRARVAAARLAQLHAVDGAADYSAAMQRLRAIDVRWYLVTGDGAPRWDPARKRAAFVARGVALYAVRDTSR
ncbi:MAG TPA: hypothetical protein VEG36_13590 [Burkholderiales bacterium]|nr:hypothetical protein [Burkholderiales bacterium]